MASWFNNDRAFFTFAVGFYGLSMLYSIFLWRRGFRKDNRVNYLLLLTGFGLHTGAMLLRGFRLDRCPITNLYEATTFITWTIVGIYLLLGVWSRLRFLGAFASPLLFAIGVFALMPGFDASGPARPEVPGPITSAHAALMALSYGAFGLSAIAALMYLTQERNLKFHKLQAVFSLMPPIQRLELATGRLMIAGFTLLSVGLIVGAAGLRHIEDTAIYRADPKIIWTVLVWLAYVGLILMRWKFAQRGRRFAMGVIGSFAFILLTFWGSNMLSPLHHP